MSQYDADYFLRGKETGKSLYTDYRWLPELTIPMCAAMARFLGIEKHHTILDFGCARGYSVRAFREMGYKAWGMDVSPWAVENADETVKNLVGHPDSFNGNTWDWIIAKDVLEHVPDIQTVLRNLMARARIGVFIVVPLGANGRYVIPEYEEDVTHLHRWPMKEWLTRIVAATDVPTPPAQIQFRYLVDGIKDNWRKWPQGNGFITLRKL